MAEPVRHRQTKGAETDMLSLPPPRHISTLPWSCENEVPDARELAASSVAVRPADISTPM
jgi:hypothetical protein